MIPQLFVIASEMLIQIFCLNKQNDIKMADENKPNQLNM